MDLQARHQHLLQRLARLERHADYLGKEILFKFLDRRKVIALQKTLRDAKEDQAVELLRDIQVALIGALTPSQDVEQSINRFSNLLSTTNPDVGQIRNDLGKIADQLRIQIPRGFIF